MAIKLNISDKGKAWKVELDSEVLFGKSIGDKVSGKEIKAELDGYELEITGGSDSAGFPLSKDVPGLALKKVMLTGGLGMRQRHPDGIRKKKTLRGAVISSTIALLNLKVVKSGAKALNEIFPEQNQPKAKKEVAATTAPAA